jgi:1,2-diacylglycerol 3-beta-galactosyltransferase
LTQRTVELFYFDAGGGHRNAMNVLSRRIAVQHPDWTVVPVDLQKLLEPIDPVHWLTLKLTGSLRRWLVPIAPKLKLQAMQAQDIYNTALKRGATRGMGAILPILQGFVRRYSPAIEALLVARWRQPETMRPDLVVSVIPNFNAVLFGALSSFDPLIPYATVITDLVDCPPHFWMEDQDQSMICGTPIAYAQAQASGFYRPERIFAVSGMLLRESFYAAPDSDALSRADLGLDPDRPTALIMFGGNGSMRSTHAILKQFERSQFGLQTIVLCGNNAKLLASLKGRPRCHPVGFVSNVADYIRLADFLIGKPGPGSISEAIHLGRPVIVEGNATTMPQERPNVQWVRDNEIGIVVKSFRKEIVSAAGRMLADLDRYKANIAARIPENRAVYETVDILSRIADAAPVAEVRIRPVAPVTAHRLSPRRWLEKARSGRSRV